MLAYMPFRLPSQMGRLGSAIGDLKKFSGERGNADASRRFTGPGHPFVVFAESVLASRLSATAVIQEFVLNKLPVLALDVQRRHPIR